MTYVHGIDVSAVNGRWNWYPYSNDAFAAVRCTSWDHTPTPDIDEQFGRNWDRMKNYGITRIAYHEFRVDKCSPQDQAATFAHILRAHGLLPSDMMECVIDSPYTKGHPPELYSEAARAFISSLEEHIPNHRILVYVNVSDADAGYAAGLERHGLHIAEYEVREPQVPEPWKSAGRTWTFWQSSGSVPPDRDVFNGTRKQLEEFALKYA